MIDNRLLLFSHSAEFDSLQPHGLHAARQAHLSFTISWSLLNSCALSLWCHLSMPSSVAPFSSCPQSFPASGSFPKTQLDNTEKKERGYIMKNSWRKRANKSAWEGSLETVGAAPEVGAAESMVARRCRRGGWRLCSSVPQTRGRITAPPLLWPQMCFPTDESSEYWDLCVRETGQSSSSKARRRG